MGLIVLKNSRLVSGHPSYDSVIKIFNQVNNASFRCVNTLTLWDFILWSLAAYENTLLIVGNSEGWIHILNLTTLKLLHRIKAHSNSVSSIVALDNGNLATASLKSIRIWFKINETTFEKLPKELNGHAENIFALAVLPNRLFASASSDKSIRIWSENTLECIRVLNDHTSQVNGLAVLDNGYFVSISRDKTGIVWDSSSFSRIATVITTASEGFYSVSSYSDYSFISVDSDKTIRVWDTRYLDIYLFKKFHTTDSVTYN